MSAGPKRIVSTPVPADGTGPDETSPRGTSPQGSTPDAVRPDAELPLKWGWLLALGIALLVAGALGAGLAIWLTLASVLLFGAFLIAGGVLQAWHALTTKERRWSGRALHLLVAVLYVVLGAMLLFDPVGGSLSLTLLLTAFLIAIGLSRIAHAWRSRRRGWRWGATFVAGLLNLALAALIFVGLPVTALWVIGLFVAFEMILNGALLIGVALAVRRLARDGRGRRDPTDTPDASADPVGARP